MSEPEGETGPILIAGPTASGKSRLALALAAVLARRGVASRIVNADAMQVYRALRIVTARPTAEDEAAHPHCLFGYVDGETSSSVGLWLAAAAAAIDAARQAGARPIVVGGTGLYFAALTEGLSAVPAIPVDIRRHWRDRQQSDAPDALHATLARRSPADAAAIRPSDTQRIVRALEVVEATGRSLADWQRAPKRPPPVLPDTAPLLCVDLPRDRRRVVVAERFTEMLADGALDEVAALPDLIPDREHPLWKAIGVRELEAHLAGTVTLEEAEAAAVRNTLAFIKRQETWLARRMANWTRVDPGADAAAILDGLAATGQRRPMRGDGARSSASSGSPR